MWMFLLQSIVPKPSLNSDITKTVVTSWREPWSHGITAVHVHGRWKHLGPRASLSQQPANVHQEQRFGKYALSFGSCKYPFHVFLDGNFELRIGLRSTIPVIAAVCSGTICQTYSEEHDSIHPTSGLYGESTLPPRMKLEVCPYGLAKRTDCTYRGKWCFY